MLKTAFEAGQLTYIAQRGLTNEGWRVLIEVHYYFNRSASQINFHKDTLGETVFVNLMYMNKKTIAGPEYIVNPPSILEHDQNTANKLHPNVREDIGNLRKMNPVPDTVNESYIPPFHTIAFFDEGIHHTTPNIGPRRISPSDIESWIKSDAFATFGMGQAFNDLIGYFSQRLGYEALNAKYQTADWRLWVKMAMASKGTSYTRSDLQIANFPAKVIDEMIDSLFSKGYSTVAVPNAGKGNRIPIELNGQPLRLKRRASESNLYKKHNLEPGDQTPRCFFRVWIRCIAPDVNPFV
jgi:hypothetical protein